MGMERMNRLITHPKHAFARNGGREPFPVIHITGTNGKGSCAAMLSSILKEAGMRVGTFMSPAVLDPTETIQIDWEPITKADFATLHSFIDECASEADSPNDASSDFERHVAGMLHHFGEQAVDIAVVEVGMGGRRDATNVFTAPLLSLITPIGLDHTNFMGPTVMDIAAEKSGIIKPGRPVVVAPQPYAIEVLPILGDRAHKLNAPITLVDMKDIGLSKGKNADQQPTTYLHYKDRQYPLGLFGKHQLVNTACVVECIETLNTTQLPTDIEFPQLSGKISISDEAVQRGLLATKLPCRMEVFKFDKVGDMNEKTVLLDGAHNPEGARALLETMADPWFNPFGRGGGGPFMTVVIAMMKDKDPIQWLKTVVPQRRLTDSNTPTHIVVTSVPDLPHIRAGGGWAPKELQEAILAEFPALQDRISVVESIPTAVTVALSDASDKVLISGSLYMVGVARGTVQNVHSEHKTW
eukprot:TRINITY_DN95611_c0_g1_i1.p1 TRINITY_DN95611_c0_g1~~TRINITY_DN95611_c0_g1_i1.p1  ORF type:complete len:491 (-),score=56.83 TRINITY_DN95611_c0_g1_i1:36-1442(-)